MAETAITPQNVDVTGTAITFEAANAAGNKIDLTTGPKILHVKNTHATLTRTVTLVTTGTVAGLAIADRAVVVPALTGDLEIRLDDVLKQSDGFCHITYSADTNVTVAVKNA